MISELEKLENLLDFGEFPWDDEIQPETGIRKTEKPDSKEIFTPRLAVDHVMCSCGKKGYKFVKENGSTDLVKRCASCLRKKKNKGSCLCCFCG